ncbi:hypothetical protein BDZ89DRAFT_1038566 [Hymenopellis radicata]|nr:hypothetical protein BDZ89DRAFT_1038566 [Hymenopellis radicata]
MGVVTVRFRYLKWSLSALMRKVVYSRDHDPVRLLTSTLIIDVLGPRTTAQSALPYFNNTFFFFIASEFDLKIAVALVPIVHPDRPEIAFTVAPPNYNRVVASPSLIDLDAFTWPIETSIQLGALSDNSLWMSPNPHDSAVRLPNLSQHERQARRRRKRKALSANGMRSPRMLSSSRIQHTERNRGQEECSRCADGRGRGLKGPKDPTADPALPKRGVFNKTAAISSRTLLSAAFHDHRVLGRPRRFFTLPRMVHNHSTHGLPLLRENDQRLVRRTTRVYSPLVSMPHTPRTVEYQQDLCRRCFSTSLESNGASLTAPSLQCHLYLDSPRMTGDCSTSFRDDVEPSLPSEDIADGVVMQRYYYKGIVRPKLEERDHSMENTPSLWSYTDHFSHPPSPQSARLRLMTRGTEWEKTRGWTRNQRGDGVTNQPITGRNQPARDRNLSPLATIKVLTHRVYYEVTAGAGYAPVTPSMGVVTVRFRYLKWSLSALMRKVVYSRDHDPVRLLTSTLIIDVLGPRTTAQSALPYFNNTFFFFIASEFDLKIAVALVPIVHPDRPEIAFTVAPPNYNRVVASPSLIDLDAFTWPIEHRSNWAHYQTTAYGCRRILMTQLFDFPIYLSMNDRLVVAGSAHTERNRGQEECSRCADGRGRGLKGPKDPTADPAMLGEVVFATRPFPFGFAPITALFFDTTLSIAETGVFNKTAAISSRTLLSAAFHDHRVLVVNVGRQFFTLPRMVHNHSTHGLPLLRENDQRLVRRTTRVYSPLVSMPHTPRTVEYQQDLCRRCFSTSLESNGASLTAPSLQCHLYLDSPRMTGDCSTSFRDDVEPSLPSEDIADGVVMQRYYYKGIVRPKLEERDHSMENTPSLWSYTTTSMVLIIANFETKPFSRLEKEKCHLLDLAVLHARIGKPDSGEKQAENN